jgi:hypothetical protein
MLLLSARRVSSPPSAGLSQGRLRGERSKIMEQNRRDVFAKIGMLSASALALVGVSRRAKADAWNERQNPLLGLWDLTVPVQQGLLAPLYYKYAISEGGYVATGSEDANAAYLLPYTYSPTVGTYTRTGPYSYRLRERRWAMGVAGAAAGCSDFTGTAVVAGDGRSWSGSGTYTQNDPDGNVVLTLPLAYSAVRFLA